MFINLTNHPSEHWNDKQRAAAQAYGEIVDLPFPPLENRASLTHEQALEIARSYLRRLEELKPRAVLCAGDFYMTFMLVDALKKHGFLVLITLSNRETTEVFHDDGTSTKTSIFNFVGFQEYRYFSE